MQKRSYKSFIKFIFGLRRLIFRPFFITTKNALGRRSRTFRRARILRAAGSAAAITLMVLCAGTLAPLYAVPAPAEATTGTATESSLTFTSINPTASVSLSVSDPSGTFASSTDTQKAKFTISTTNYTGYTVSLKSSSQNLTDGTNSLSPIPSALSQDDFSLSTNTQYNNKWGININNASTFIPVTSNVTIDETSSANTTAKEYTIGLGVRADYTYAESTYYNTFVIEYVANQINYVINYDANAGSDTVTNMPTSPQTGYTNATSITIASATPVRSNYEFKGWCNTTTSDDSCSGTTYQPGATYGVDQTVSNEITLHAMWESTAVSLYDTIAGMSKGDFEMANINVALTTDNSGVYKYTGEASDGNGGTQDIYFYRGVLDSTFTSGSYGSSGDGKLTPNYVKLTTNGNVTCWRIFRTTKTGGVKMLYNGSYTNETCAADADGSALFLSTYAYGTGGGSCAPTSSNSYCGTRGFVTYVGYNYNSTYAYNHTGYTAAVANSTLFNNSTASNIRTRVENWYSSTIGSANNKLFEWDAGYCNDRSTPKTNTGGSVAETVPYKTSQAAVYFGAYVRADFSKTPSLQCPNTSGNDLLDGTTGKRYPVALITFDEAELAGNGWSSNNASSYLTSGSTFWTLSPGERNNASGSLYVHVVGPTGNGSWGDAAYSNRVRPAISLAPETMIYSGTGTAADPWIVQAN